MTFREALSNCCKLQIIIFSLTIANKLVTEIMGIVFKVNSKFKEINSPVFPLKTGWAVFLESIGLMILPPGNRFSIKNKGFSKGPSINDMPSLGGGGGGERRLNKF